MDAFHERLDRVGRCAVRAHGILERPSEDDDLFTALAAAGQFPYAVRTAITAFAADGLDADVLVENPGFARLTVTDPESGRASKVELGIDWRQHPPTTLAIGPVLARDDAVANKVNALYSRGQARDYIDVDAAVLSGGYPREQLLILAKEHDPGFEPTLFAEALRAVRRLPTTEFTPYGLDDHAASALVERLLSWAKQIDDHS